MFVVGISWTCMRVADTTAARDCRLNYRNWQATRFKPAVSFRCGCGKFTMLLTFDWWRRLRCGKRETWRMQKSWLLSSPPQSCVRSVGWTKNPWRNTENKKSLISWVGISGQLENPWISLSRLWFIDNWEKTCSPKSRFQIHISTLLHFYFCLLELWFDMHLTNRRQITAARNYSIKSSWVP